MYQIGSYRNALVASYTWPKLSNDYYPFGSSLPTRSWSDVSRVYRYGFNMQEIELELSKSILTAEYWEYHSQLGRRFNLDPIPFASLSSFCAFANSPIYYNDLKGNTFDAASQERIQKHKKDINDKIDQLKSYKKSLLGLMLDGSDNEYLWKGIAQADKAIQELSNQLNEIKVLEESTQVYKIDTKAATNGTKMNLDGSITIGIKDDYKGILAHELNHAFQYENHQLSFYTYSENGNTYIATGILYDIYDEVESYRAQWAIEYYEKNSDLYEDITPANVLKYGTNNGQDYNKTFLNTETNISLNTKLTKEILIWYYGSKGLPKKKVYRKYIGKPISLYIQKVLNDFESTR